MSGKYPMSNESNVPFSPVPANETIVSAGTFTEDRRDALDGDILVAIVADSNL